MRVGGNLQHADQDQGRQAGIPADRPVGAGPGGGDLEVVIDEDGSVDNARVLRSIPLLDEAALGAVSQWRFTPTELNGRPSPWS